jgi:hypothetical protein
MPKRELYDDFVCSKLAETPRAILVSDDGGKTKHWLPKSQIEFEIDPRTGVCTVTAPIWLLQDKGLI